MFEINYEEAEPGNEEYSQSFWRKSTPRRTRVLVALGAVVPYYFNGRWDQHYLLYNPLSWVAWLLAVLGNGFFSFVMTFVATTHIMFWSRGRLPGHRIRSWEDAPAKAPE